MCSHIVSSSRSLCARKLLVNHNLHNMTKQCCEQARSTQQQQHYAVCAWVKWMPPNSHKIDTNAQNTRRRRWYWNWSTLSFNLRVQCKCSMDSIQNQAPQQQKHRSHRGSWSWILFLGQGYDRIRWAKIANVIPRAHKRKQPVEYQLVAYIYWLWLLPKFDTHIVVVSY